MSPGTHSRQPHQPRWQVRAAQDPNCAGRVGHRASLRVERCCWYPPSSLSLGVLSPEVSPNLGRSSILLTTLPLPLLLTEISLSLPDGCCRAELHQPGLRRERRSYAAKSEIASVCVSGCTTPDEVDFWTFGLIQNAPRLLLLLRTVSVVFHASRYVNPRICLRVRNFR